MCSLFWRILCKIQYVLIKKTLLYSQVEKIRNWFGCLSMYFKHLIQFMLVESLLLSSTHSISPPRLHVVWSSESGKDWAVLWDTGCLAVGGSGWIVSLPSFLQKPGSLDKKLTAVTIQYKKYKFENRKQNGWIIKKNMKLLLMVTWVEDEGMKARKFKWSIIFTYLIQFMQDGCFFVQESSMQKGRHHIRSLLHSYIGKR